MTRLPALRHISPALFTLIVLCMAVEAALSLGDLGFVGPPRMRNLVYEAAAFWPGLLKDWQPNYPAQPVLMFVSYSFLHGGPLHLAMNMITLASLGRAVIDRVGTRGFLIVWAAAAVAGAGVYALLSMTGAPMVGASGALFGLAGAILAWVWEDQATFRGSLWLVGRLVAFLVAINVAMYWALDGRLAWETHLGGFLAGWIMGIALYDGPGGRARAR